MNVRVEIMFESPGEDELARMRSLACGLTDRPDSVRVFAGEKPRWLVAEFTMPTEAQYKAVSKIDWAMRSHAGDRWDSTIRFPKTAAEQARADRKNVRRRARRRER
jgi:hypothetical protein